MADNLPDEIDVPDVTDTEMWREIRRHGQEKRAGNRERAPNTLERFGVSFSCHNGGAHLIVRLQGRIVDFWPGTGKWTERREVITTARPRTGRGIFNMLRHLGVDVGCGFKH